jgi:hypothetical protein
MFNNPSLVIIAMLVAVVIAAWRGKSKGQGEEGTMNMVEQYKAAWINQALESVRNLDLRPEIRPLVLDMSQQMLQLAYKRMPADSLHSQTASFLIEFIKRTALWINSGHPGDGLLMAGAYAEFASHWRGGESAYARLVLQALASQPELSSSYLMADHVFLSSLDGRDLSESSKGVVRLLDDYANKLNFYPQPTQSSL